MIIALSLAALVMAMLLVLVTLVQMLYMDSVRVRAREIAFLELFRERVSERIGMRADDGILSFSLIKHSLLALLGVVFMFFAGEFGLAQFLEAAALSWLTMLISSYVIPQSLYRRTSGEWFLSLVPVVQVLAILVRPLTGLLGFLQSLAQLGGRDNPASETSSAEDNIDALITAGAEEGILEEEDRKLIQSVVAFGDKTVREVMTPRPSIVMIAADATLEQLHQIVIHEQYSRIPIYEGTIDNITGFVHVRDMFQIDDSSYSSRRVREVARPIRAIPESKPVNDLMREMQSEGTHMAIVIDEYGSTAGLVTMEDMVEEIVGEIRDEHEPAHDMVSDSEGRYIVSGSFDVDHLGDLLGFRPAEDTESTTVGGLVTEWMGRVPAAGESVEHEGLRIEVMGANELRVEQVRISRAKPAVSSNGSSNGKDKE
ncbi:MAG: HlyC/CorC family transporter [Bryobacteraceae bacterium]|nr:HlyC/CorC family transporter [Bryobacteraceae bacterium]